MNNGVNNQRKKFREALLYCLTEEDIQDHIKSLIEISQSTKESTSNRLKAIQMIFDYTVGKPKQDYGIELENEDNTISGITVEIVSPELKDIKKTYSNHNEYITAIGNGEITKEDNVLIGEFKRRDLEI